MRIPGLLLVAVVLSVSASVFAGCGSLSGSRSGGNSDCASVAVPGSAFGASVAVSGTFGSYVPSMAARADGELLVWHEFVGPQPVIAWSLIREGCVSAPRHLDVETSPRQLHPSVAATATGWVLAYQALIGTNEVIRVVHLDPAGDPVAGPDTVSAPGAAGASVRVSAAGDDVAFAWTDGFAHHFALEGSRTVSATSVGTTLLSTGPTNFPRVLLEADGTLHLAWRDGGATAGEWDTFLVDRPAGGPFATPKNLSNSPAEMSDEISIALEPDGTLDAAWVEQVGVDFEVKWSKRAPGGSFTTPVAFAGQSAEPWFPSVAPGLATVWHEGPSEVAGDFLFSDGPIAAVPILAGEQGGFAALARAPDGSLHLAFTTGGTPRRVRYAWRR